MHTLTLGQVKVKTDPGLGSSGGAGMGQIGVIGDGEGLFFTFTVYKYPDVTTVRHIPQVKYYSGT